MKTGRAWAIKELLRELWLCPTKEEGQEHFDKWYSWAIRSRLEPIKKAARTLKTHLEQVLNYFTHRLTNALSEGLNSVIERLKQQACGYRNDDNLRIAILSLIFFFIMGLILLPFVNVSKAIADAKKYDGNAV